VIPEQEPRTDDQSWPMVSRYLQADARSGELQWETFQRLIHPKPSKFERFKTSARTLLQELTGLRT
jgi:hypothetical protein